MPADHWIETYRGTVFRWEVDSNDHLTVAYYLSRFGDAAITVLHALGLGPAPTVECYIHYSRELRVGDLMHVTSGVLAAEADGLVLGHKLVESTEGARIVRANSAYLYAQFQTRWLKFVDDAEFFADVGANVVHVRSASRIGRRDFGVNRARIEAIRARFASD